ncbi:hypothetical protein XENTR_v10017910 [Xenopus tropicalis]|uniref:Actin related protein T2 n=1 Tax=Xenopus tropicalis TaxID=8364 RepID=Q6DF47_XENTR|eukprot:NP_001006111.1 actin,beta [Xenopus tropicalis]
MTDLQLVHKPAVIFDIGSGNCKAGMSGEDLPTAVVPSVVGHLSDRSAMLGAGQQPYYVGEMAMSKRAILDLVFPIKEGIVKSWDNMIKIWKYLYKYELKKPSSEHPVFLTEAPLNPLRNRHKMAEIFFENFNVPAMYVSHQANLALYASGLTTGIVLDVGAGITHTVAIYDGVALPHAVSKLPVAGRTITQYLMKLLTENGYNFITAAEREIVRDIKEKLCYIALDPSAEYERNPKDITKEYTLPDGNVIKIDSQLFRAPEALFSPSNIGLEAPGVQGLINNIIQKCPIDIRRALLSNVVLSGGSTLFPGFDERVLRELEKKAPDGVQIKVLAATDRKYSVWIGASVLSSMDSFKENWIRKSEYDEFGPSIVHQK